MGKRFLAIILIILFLFCAIVGCTQNAASIDVAIDVFIYDMADTYISEMAGKLRQAFTNEDVRFFDATRSQSIQNQQIVEAIEKRNGLLIVNAVDRLACNSIVRKARASDLPVIFFNREPLEADIDYNNIYYVGAAADSLGRLQARMIDQFIKTNGMDAIDSNGDGIIQTIILKGEQGHQDAELRTRFCISEMMQLGYSVDILSISVANWTREEGKKVMGAQYEKHQDKIELVFSNNDDMALGAIDFMLEKELFTEKEDYDQPFVIVGVDATSAGLEAIDKGLLYGTVLNDSTAQVDAIVQLARFIRTERNIEDFPFKITNDRYVFIDGEIITSSDN